MGVMCFSKSLHRRRPTSCSRRADSLLHRTRHAAPSSAAGTAPTQSAAVRCGAKAREERDHNRTKALSTAERIAARTGAPAQR